MCGISGWVGEGASRHVVERMTRSLEHRGPDGFHVVTPPGAVLGAQRLAIRDRARGQQPVEVDGVWALLNGEIYNDADLWADLPRTTDCDTELLARLQHARPDFISSLNGMFALAIYQGVSKRLTLARDRMGRRPLYYARVDGGLVFGSELRALMAHPGVPRELDPDAVPQYLLYEAVPAPRTILRGVHKLEPGEQLTFQDGTIQRSFFYRPTFQAAMPSRDEDVLDALEERLALATRRRIAREVPTGCLLSGGIDSSLVALLAGADGPMPSFALGWESADYDESDVAVVAARAAGTTHHTLILGDREVAEEVPRILAHMDEPLGDESVVPTWFVSRFAREHVTVALTGDGGDELFDGYPTLLADDLAQRIDAMGLADQAGAAANWLARLLGADSGPVGLEFQARAFARGLSYPRLLRHPVWLSAIDPERQSRLLRHDVLTETGDPLAPTLLEIKRLAAMAGTPQASRSEDDVLRWLYLRHFLADNLLMKVDKPAMAHALETRSPLLDNDVVAFALALPPRFNRRGGTLKWALRELARRRGLPESLVTRKKRGFTAPNAGWLAGPLRDWMEDLLSPASLDRVGLFRSDVVASWIAEHVDGHTNHRKPLWTLCALMAWERRWLG